MRRLTTILLILVALNLNAQSRKDTYISIGIITSSIVLDAMGDAYNDSGNKVLGHSLNAFSLAPLILSPFILDLEDYKWFGYLAQYVTLRISIFDPIYNLTRGLPLGYIGTTSLWDKAIGATKSPEGWIMMGRGLSFVVSISIPIKYY